MDLIGHHIIGGTSLAMGRPRIVKLCDCSVEYVRQARGAVGPGSLIVVRWVEQNQYRGDPEYEATLWFHRREAGTRHRERRPQRDVWGLQRGVRCAGATLCAL